MSFGSREVPTGRVSTSAPNALHCWAVFLRLVLLLVFAVAIATGAGGPADVLAVDSIGAVATIADGEPDALGVEPTRVPVTTYHVIPLVLHGTEVEHPSPEMARVFRPPRASFV